MDICETSFRSFGGRVRECASFVLVLESSHFRVKNVSRFRRALKKWPNIEVLRCENDYNDEVFLMCGDLTDNNSSSEEYHWPREESFLEFSADFDPSFLAAIQRHLRPLQRCVIREYFNSDAGENFQLAVIPAEGKVKQANLEQLAQMFGARDDTFNPVYYPGDIDYKGRGTKPQIRRR
jgi:hypothetical protein